MKPPTTPSLHGRFAGWAIPLAVLMAAGCEPAVYVRTSGIVGDAGLHDTALNSHDDGPEDATGGRGGSVVGSGGAAGTGSGGAGLGSGGAPSTGGTPGSGGSASTGGTTGSGGASSTGGTTGSGGAVSSGGAPGTGGTTGTGGTSSSGGAVGTGGAPMTDTARYNFETTIQSWMSMRSSAMFTSVTRSSARAFAGQFALAGAINATAAGTYQTGVTPMAAIPSGTTITFHVFYPSGSTIEWVQPFAQEGVSPYTWFGKAIFTRNLTAGVWNTITVTIPSGSGAIGSVGVQVSVTGAWNGTVYIDSVTW